MTTPPDIHEDLLEAAKLAVAANEPYRVDFAPSGHQSWFCVRQKGSPEPVFFGNDAECELWIAQQVAKAVAAYLLSRPASEEMVKDGAAVPQMREVDSAIALASIHGMALSPCAGRTDSPLAHAFTAMQHQRLISYGIKP